MKLQEIITENLTEVEKTLDKVKARKTVHYNVEGLNNHFDGNLKKIYVVIQRYIGNLENGIGVGMYSQPYIKEWVSAYKDYEKIIKKLMKNEERK